MALHPRLGDNSGPLFSSAASMPVGRVLAMRQQRFEASMSQLSSAPPTRQSLSELDERQGTPSRLGSHGAEPSLARQPWPDRTPRHPSPVLCEVAAVALASAAAVADVVLLADRATTDDRLLGGILSWPADPPTTRRRKGIAL
eukprot:TRINITY_DN16913_c0_g1_i3.p1 TRINITY_DN16913_c0_g1~~TRINITY_DN16913_c0_g1_i3.p1  ORF type:complete len:143 (-),score=16.85 TRINITY_DN16913_c0_g1_i3:89-517(-)